MPHRGGEPHVGACWGVHSSRKLGQKTGIFKSNPWAEASFLILKREPRYWRHLRCFIFFLPKGVPYSIKPTMSLVSRVYRLSNGVSRLEMIIHASKVMLYLVRTCKNINPVFWKTSCRKGTSAVRSCFVESVVSMHSFLPLLVHT